ARDAMPHGGMLQIEAQNIRVEKSDAERHTIPPGDYVSIKITDTGVGMRSDVARRAFEPFFTTKEAGRGTGLGLSMVYGFARQSGGTAELESRAGSGTTITLYFPRSQKRAAREPPPTAAHPPIARNASILVVEDQDEVRQLLSDSLEEVGHEVATARTAEEAIALLGQNTRIEVLVTDITLPGRMTGLDLVQQARELVPDIKILTISGNASEASIKAPYIDRLAFLPKPFRLSDLNRAVGELL